MLSNKTAVKDLLAICLEKKVKNVVFSPGSRNAPLILSFTNNPDFECLSIPDERSAGFFALGMAQQLKRPVILSCTSGSAALNYAPAIVEAYYQKIPLIVITSDRPLEWIDQGNGQTMRQTNIYNQYIKKSYNLVQESEHPDDRWYNQRQISEAFEICNNQIPGPVHINFGFREPLYERDNNSSKVKVVDTIKTTSLIDPGELSNIISLWNNSPRKLIICGQNTENSALEYLLTEVANDPSVAILTESTSNLHGQYFNPCIDRVITTFSDEEKLHFKPDLIITLGGAIVSKKIKALIRSFEVQHWHVGFEYQYIDVFKSLTKHIPIPASDFLNTINENANNIDSSFRSTWLNRTQKTKQSHLEFTKSCEWSDLKAFKAILNALPPDSIVHMANSTPVRYVQLFEPRKELNYLSNRGVSGIDGGSSTAAGFSYVSNKVNTLITGDIGFLYDSNALWNKHLKGNLKIIVLNNQGGGIFRIIEGPSSSLALEEFFECHHPVDISSIAKAYNVNYNKATDELSLEAQLKLFFADNELERPSILEIVTPREKNEQILAEYFSFIKA